jgi:hypothetical protein
VDENYRLPIPVDLIAEARRLVDLLEADLESKKGNDGGEYDG